MEAWESIQNITSKFTGLASNKLTRESRIENDLGITGDDAEEYLQKFIDNFSVNVEGFDISKYFDDEGFDPIGISLLIRRILKKPMMKKSEHQLTLGDLELWAIHGNWADVEKRITK
jgi:hypothetical protein